MHSGTVVSGRRTAEAASNEEARPSRVKNREHPQGYAPAAGGYCTCCYPHRPCAGCLTSCSSSFASHTSALSTTGMIVPAATYWATTANSFQ